ncbi:MAG: redoxin domain-containing protein [Eubacteriales bacterium]|nr:redoxin domain-containing protein [Eubacteriales bacterium]
MSSLISQDFPEFTLKAFHENEIKTIKREDTLGHWSIFFFYPADFTFVCPTELSDLADHYDEFTKMGAEVYSVSCDTVYVHKAWKDSSDRIRTIQYPMLGDPLAILPRALDVFNEQEGTAYRATFVVDPEGKIVAYEVNADGIGRNAEELLRKLEAAAFVHEHGDQVCPANWHPGEETIKPSLDLVGLL